MNVTQLQTEYTEMLYESDYFHEAMKTSLKIQNLKEGICAGTIQLSGTPDQMETLLGLAKTSANSPFFEYITSSTKDDGTIHTMLVNTAY
jgi:hypothetical protein